MPSSAWNKNMSSDRKSTRLNSSHTIISYGVFWLNKNATPLSRPDALDEARLPAPAARPPARHAAACRAQRRVLRATSVPSSLLFFFKDAAPIGIFLLPLGVALPF